jgi:hypothetical protein
MKKIIKAGKNILVLFVILDALIVALHVLFPDKAVFNLDFESNLPTIYQGAKLILISLLALMILTLSYLEGREIRKDWFWVFWSSMMFFLAVDEMGQIHENVSQYIKEILGQGVGTFESTVADLGYSSTPWLKYYLVLFLVATAIVISFIKRMYKKDSKTVWYLIIGWLFFLGVPIIEYINTMPHIMFQEGYEALMIIEEVFEIAGASFLVTFTYEIFFEKLLRIKSRLRNES